MGLDITAYGVAVLTEPHEHDDDDIDNEHHIFLYDSPHVWHRADSLIVGRCYDVSGGESMGFRAGSYSGYNTWREALSRAALGVEPRTIWNDPDSYAFRPFVELIHFSDCEGVIGPETSAKLAKDFANEQNRVVDALLRYDQGEGASGWYVSKYADWRSAFELAADTGLVDFH